MPHLRGMQIVLACLLGLWAPSAEDLDPAAAAAVLHLQGKFHHVQGIDVEGMTLWVSSVDAPGRKGYLSRVDLATGRLQAQIEIQAGERIHPGGISLQGHAIWVPVAEYRQKGKTTIQKRNKHSLALEAEFSVDDHIGCLAAGPGWIAGGNWDSLQIYFWNPAGRLLRKMDNPNGNGYQDMKWIDSSLVASGILAKDTARRGAIDWLSKDTLKLKRRLTAGKTDRGIVLTNEGIALRRGKLYLLPEDDPSRLFIFDLKK